MSLVKVKFWGVRGHPRFRSLWKRLGGSTDYAHTVVEELLAAYQGSERVYHDIYHVRACLALFDSVVLAACHPEEVEAALWFHDAAYDTHRSDNEERSAEVWRRHASKAGIDADIVDRVASSIVSTRHHEGDGDARLVIEIDLSILGSDPITYDSFEAAIAREYAWVPTDAFRSGRRAVLSGFLARQRIFTIPELAHLEGPARDNITRAIAGLR